ncbi:uncharacterized protein LOC141605667 [Silene latifolia]|uniref:uncharacterized protein LOC141605667 n=1 Tax=Silene latifolia TaxID=37657 RepID=UPI003D78610F
MEDVSSVDFILEFLQKKGFSRAEAALRCELGNRPDKNGFQKLVLEEKEKSKKVLEENVKLSGKNQESSSWRSGESSGELIVKEIECGTNKNGKDSTWKATTTTPTEHKTPVEAVGVTDKGFTFSRGSEDAVLDLYTWKPNQDNDSGSSQYHVSEESKAGKIDVQPENELAFHTEKRLSWVSTSAKLSADQESNLKDVDQRKQSGIVQSKEKVKDELWMKNEEGPNSSAGQWKGCTVKSVLSFSSADIPTTSDSDIRSGAKEGSRKTDTVGIRTDIKEQVDEVGRSLYLAKLQGICDKKNLDDLGLPMVFESQKEDFPRLPPVRLKSEDKPLCSAWEERFDHDGPSLKLGTSDNAYLIGSYLDVPVGQEINSSGAKRNAGGNWLSVSRGITEDTTDLVSGFATIGDGLSESIDYPNDYWDSDEYDDDDDVGYMRQPIDDEAWFLAHEIDYPSDNEKGNGHGSIPDPQERVVTKNEEDDQSFADEDSYFLGEQYIHSRNMNPISASDDPIGLSVSEVYDKVEDNDLIARYDGQLMDEEELSLMRSEPVWQGFVTQSDDLIMLEDGKVMNECRRLVLDDVCLEDDQHGSVRSIGVGINSDAADVGSEVRDSLIGGSSEGDLEYFHDHEVGLGAPRYPQNRTINDRKKTIRQNTDMGFSFVPPMVDEPMSVLKSAWSRKSDAVGNEHENCLEDDDSTSSPGRSPENDENVGGRSAESTPSTLSDYVYAENERVKKADDVKTANVREADVGAALEDEEAAAVQEQVRQIKAQEEEFETFNLKIIHRKNRTGFEEDKNFHVVLNSVIAGRYHVTEYLGSAAFSKAIQAHDLHTGMDVCVKIIKNNKDFFDQSLDEIKLLKYVNKHDPGDKFHLLRLYDYFYYREHLLIVCELLKANLYEFHKFNRESGGEVYFTMPRLQSITIQVLEALRFLHGLGLIHCDLKPENILVKSYSRCEVKVIDLGSSCFETDHLCSYVQSRSYRAPEVILGLSYDKKIDIWSLGCILAELCTGNVLFQNDSPATLLARVIGIIAPIDQEMLAKGRDTYKYFTKNHMLYERNQETSRLEYLIPKKTSLRHRLPMGDQGFIDFVGHLLEINPKKRPTASEALKHPWLSYPYEPISS